MGNVGALLSKCLKKPKQTTVESATAKGRFVLTDEIVNAKGRGTTLTTARGTRQDRIVEVLQRSHFRHASQLSVATLCKYGVQVKDIIGDLLGAA